MTKPLIKHYGRVMNGRKVYHNKALYYQQIALLEGKEFEEVIKVRHSKVTNDQYGFYFGGILTTCYEGSELFSAFDKAADIHIYFEDKFLSYKTIVIVGDKKKEIVRHRSLTELNKQEMSDFISKVLLHCRAELNIEILDPDQYYDENYRTIKK